jgi:hypothetical protein
MKENILKTLEIVISDIELKPKMFFVNPDYTQLSSYLLGYLTCIDDIYSTSINKIFSEWVNKRGKKTSLFWPQYILKISADGNDANAYEILIQEFKLFISDSTTLQKNHLS